jgi:hypothetical protein
VSEITRDIPEIIPAFSKEYRVLFDHISNELSNNRHISYTPICNAHHPNDTLAQTVDALAGRDLDTIICVGRDKIQNPAYDEQLTYGNYVLGPNSLSNVERTAALYKAALAQDSTPEFIASGWMHNRHLDTFLELPTIAQQIGSTVIDLCDLSVNDFGRRVSNLSISAADKQNLLDKFRHYPKDSEATLLAQEMTIRGIPQEFIYEEDEAFDTITNLLFCRDRLERTNAQNIAIVATTDHLPRIMWLADYILPETMKLTFVESESRLNQVEFNATCAREYKSFLAGSRWLKSVSRDPESILDLIYNGYLNPKTRRTAADVAQNVATQAS